MSQTNEPARLEVPLLDGEVVVVADEPEKPAADDADLNARYAQEGVRIVVEQARYPLSQILGMFTDTFEDENGLLVPKYKRDPEYQRRHRWDDGRKSRLVESFLMNVPVPPVFLYEYDLARFEVMDGRQRLTALTDFYENKLVLSGLQYWSELNGRTYRTLPSSIRNGIDRRYLSSIILLNETAASPEQAATLKKLVFERLNSGGVKLSGQETRNAVYDGPLNDLCLELSRLIELRAMIGTPRDLDPKEMPFRPDDQSAADEPDHVDSPAPVQGDDGVVVTALGQKMFESMEDVELVLRFFAYRHLSKFRQGLNRISDFLDQFLVRGNRLPPETISGYRDLFQQNIKFWHEIGGPAAFQVKARRSRQFSKIAYDALMFSSSILPPEQRDELRNSPQAVRGAVEKMYDAPGNPFSGRSTNTVDAHRRNQAAWDALQEALAVARQ